MCGCRCVSGCFFNAHMSSSSNNNNDYCLRPHFSFHLSLPSLTPFLLLLLPPSLPFSSYSSVPLSPSLLLLPSLSLPLPPPPSHSPSIPLPPPSPSLPLPQALKYGKYTSQSDVWSYGILLWEMFSCGSVPYPGLSNSETVVQVNEGHRMDCPRGCPVEVHDLMKRCWLYEPEDRPTFPEIVQELKKIKEKYK